MSVRVPVEALAAELAGFAPACHLITVGPAAAPHVVAITPTWDGDRLTAPVGRSTVANAGARPAVVLLWAPPAPGAMSLIVDGEATVAAPDGDGSEGRIWIHPTGAVRHRPAPGATP